MGVKQVNNNSEVDERLTALTTNANAIRAVTSAVEGTIGPKGLDTMLVDKFGDVVITNDGVTILSLMEVNHPAAKMLIKTAAAQQSEIGDGTTTAAILAGGLIGEGVNQVVRGVPVARVLEGMRLGIRRALELFREKARPIAEQDENLLRQVALVAGREHEDIADLVVQASQLVGKEKLKEPGFKLADTIRAVEGAGNEVFFGVLINKQRLNRQMPGTIEPVKVLVIDDALEPEEIEEEALGTEAGFSRYLELQNQFQENLRRVAALGVNLVLVDRGVDDIAEEILTDAGVVVVQRVSSKELRQAAEHTGARMIKRTGLRKSDAELEKYLGHARRAYEDEKLEHLRICDGAGKPMATILVGAATTEIVGERERMAKDAAASVQAAVCGGVLPGGGAVELAVARQLENIKQNTRGMAVYGVDCVIEALKRPFCQIVANAGYNSLEKLGDVMGSQAESGLDSLAVDCDTGAVTDMWQLGIIDPAPVKIYALKAAGELAEAILRIDTIIKKWEEPGEHKNSLVDVKP